MKVLKYVYLFILSSAFVQSGMLKCEPNLIPSKKCVITNGAVAIGEKLTLSNNDGKVIADLMFDKTSFTELPQNIFVNYPIETLSVLHSTLNHLDINNFKGGSKLKSIMFFQAKFQSVPSKIFQFSPNIELLEFIECPIQEIAENAFNNLLKLKTLKLANLPLTMYPSNMLENITTLETIAMENCSLETLPGDFFATNLNLNKIVLYRNKLKSVAVGIFDHLNNLKFLNIDANDLTDLSTSSAQNIFADFNRLQHIHISSATKKISVRSNSISKITCDDYLIINFAKFQNNSLRSFDCFRDMKQAKAIHLDNNNLSHLNSEDFRHLQYLGTFTILNNSRLETNAEIFSDLKNIMELSVDQLSSGYGNIRKNLPKLKNLSLQTTSWNCSYQNQIKNILRLQNISPHFTNICL